jgi:hypothetical protein
MSVPEMKAQRDQALACLILAVCITLAVFLSVFGNGDRTAIDDGRRAVALHEGILRESAGDLKNNQIALSAVSAALANFERTHPR